LFVSTLKRNANQLVKEKTLKNPKRLIAAVALTFALGAATFAGETYTPPCAPPDPGIMSTPPCTGGQTVSDSSAIPGVVSTPSASDSGYLAEAAITLFESLLPLY